MKVMSERLWGAGRRITWTWTARFSRPYGKMRPATSSPGSQAVADAGGSLWRPRRASRGAVAFELTASQLLSTVINVAQNKWDWGELGPELLPWDELATTRARRSGVHERNGHATPGFFEQVYELIIEANRNRVRSATSNVP